MNADSLDNLHLASLRAIDAGFQRAGLVRSLRRKNAPRRRVAPPRLKEPQDFSTAPPRPTHAPNGVDWLPVPGWPTSWLWAGFSARTGGVSRAYCPDDAPGELNLGLTAADSPEAVSANRRLLAEAVTGDPDTPLATLRQIHSDLLVPATLTGLDHQKPRKADGQMTDEPGFLLAVQTADCIPVLVADRKRRAVAAFHAGWRGTVARIVEKGIGRMRLVYGSRPEDLIAAIGPGIGPCCYAVGDEVLSAFDSQFSYARELFHEVYDADPVRKKYPMLFLTQRAPGHSSIGPSLHVDLIEANRRQLLAAGLGPRAIQWLGGCTQCHTDLFFSHRASHGHAGRKMAVIGIREAKARRSPAPSK